MKRKQLTTNNVGKKDRFDYRTDNVCLTLSEFPESGKCEYTKINTYYNDLQNLFTSGSYINAPEDDMVKMTRIRALNLIFQNRVEFNIDQKLSYMQAYLNQYGISNITHLKSKIVERMPELFDLNFYFTDMTNPTSGFDYALALNSLLYNHLFDIIKYDNSMTIEEGLVYVNNFMRLALNEWMHMLNLLYLEANEIYHNAVPLEGIVY